MKKYWLFAFTIMLAGAAGAQPLLDKRVSINMQNATVKEVLDFLIDEHDINLNFVPDILPKDKKITLTFRSKRLKDLLTLLLEGTEIEFEAQDGQIVIFKSKPSPPKKYIIDGYVRDAESGERVIGAAVYDPLRQAGTFTNEFGFFSITLPQGDTRLVVSYLAYQSDTVLVKLFKNQSLTIELRPSYLAEIVVNRFSDTIFLETAPSKLNFNLEQASKFPGLGGEPDFARVAYTLPGVQTGADGFGGISVRGGNVDQNLFLLDGATVYNASHGAGVFSIFDAGAIRSAQLLKGNFPAAYGGRISSVWDVETKEGNSKNFEGELEMGLSSGKIQLEGPIKKNKGSVFFSGRRSFLDFYTVPITMKLRKKDGVDGFISYFFYDLNLKANYKLSPKDRVYLSLYRGRDRFEDQYEQARNFGDTIVFLTDNEEARWGNNVASLRWNHQYSGRLFGNTNLSFSRYFYKSTDFVDLDQITADERILRDVLLLKYKSSIHDYSVKTDFDYTSEKMHRIRFGGMFTRYEFQPGIVSFNQVSVIDEIDFDTVGDYLKDPLVAHLFAGYVQDEIRAGKQTKVNVGMRVSVFSVNGKQYFHPQPRLSVQFLEGQPFSFFTSATRVVQYLHLLSPTSLGLPKDLWVSATERTPPQTSWQFVTGASQKFNRGYELSVEGYYKTLNNQLFFTDNSLNDIDATNWQNRVSLGNGFSYGAEVFLKKESRKLGGWVGYSIAKTERKFGKDINAGKPFPFRLDRRHSLSLQMLYRLKKGWELSVGFAYATGTAFSLPVQQYDFVQPPGNLPTGIFENPVGIVPSLNDRRLPAYHRLDLSANYTFVQRKTRHVLKIGVYNIYNRKNPLYLTVRDKLTEAGTIDRGFVQVSLLPAFPTLRYAMEFR